MILQDTILRQCPQKKVISFLVDKDIFINNPLLLFENKKKDFSQALSYQFNHFEKNITHKKSSHSFLAFLTGFSIALALSFIFHNLLWIAIGAVTAFFFPIASFFTGVYFMIRRGIGK